MWSYLGILILCVLEAPLPLVICFLGGGEGLLSLGPKVGGFGARLGFPCETRGRSDRSDVEKDDDGVGVAGADDNEVMLPPVETLSLLSTRPILFS